MGHQGSAYTSSRKKEHVISDRIELACSLLPSSLGSQGPIQVSSLSFCCRSSEQPPTHTQASPPLCLLPQIYWFKDGKQISPKNDHYSIRSDPSGTCSLRTAASTLEDDGNYTVMAANPQVGSAARLCSGPVGSPDEEAARLVGRWTPTFSVQLGFPGERFFSPECSFIPLDICVRNAQMCTIYFHEHCRETAVHTSHGGGAAVLGRTRSRHRR